MSEYLDLVAGTTRPRVVCPETRQSMSVAGDDVIARLRAEIESATLRNRGGETVAGELTAGFIREDGKVLYPVLDDVPVLLVEGSIELE